MNQDTQIVEGNRVKQIIERFVVTDTAKGNHAIMVFDGWELKKLQTFDPDNNYQNPGSNDYYVYEKNGKTCRIEDIEHDIVYHQSWNALMPVVEKIANLGYNISLNFQPEGGSATICTKLYDDLLRVDDFGINSTWKCIVQFITWYNSSNKK